MAKPAKQIALSMSVCVRAHRRTHACVKCVCVGGCRYVDVWMGVGVCVSCALATSRRMLQRMMRPTENVCARACICVCL